MADRAGGGLIRGRAPHRPCLILVISAWLPDPVVEQHRDGVGRVESGLNQVGQAVAVDQHGDRPRRLAGGAAEGADLVLRRQSLPSER